MLLSTAFPCRHITLGQCFVIPLIRLTHVAFFSKKYQRPPQDKLDEKDIEESFCRGAGPGGQKINKSMNKVRLRHIPTGATVAVQEQRDLTTNRSLARKLLRDKVDLIINGVDSKIGRKITKIQKRKCKTASRTKKKYAIDSSGAVDMTEDIGEDSDDSDDSDDDLNDDDDDEFRNFEESGEKSNNLIELQDDAVDSERVLESTKH